MTISLAKPSQAMPLPILTRPPLTTVVVSGWVSEAEYWEHYYEDSDHHYEWNNGMLEEKGVSDKLTLLSYEWFFELLRHYLRVTQLGQLMALETGFRLVLPNKTTIRKPDLGVILNSNPVVWNDSDNSFRGICDLCVEAISDSTTAEMERDTVTKFHEYARVGVKEYYLLYADGFPQQFYRLTTAGVYAPIPLMPPDIISSTVLPGFQFRVSDLQRQPSPEEMSEDSVYRAFMLPVLQAERQTRQQVERLLEVAESQVQQEREARQVAEISAQQERQARLAAEVRLRQLEAALAQHQQSM